MPLQSTSGAASYDAFGGGAAAKVNYIEDFFQSYLRTGTGASATVTTGLDGSTKETLVWTKSRSAATNHKLTDNVRGATKALSSNTTGAESTDSQGLTAFSATGYTIGTNTDYNNSGATYVDWQWVAQPKFFDVVTYTGTGANRTISHSLDSVPGCIIVKRTDVSADWQVYHRGLANTQYMVLNSTATVATGATRWNSTTPTSSVFSVGTDTTVNASGGTYVAYLFAHDAGGFLANGGGSTNGITCGSYVGSNFDPTTVTLGYEPQWVMIKRTTGTASTFTGWAMFDTMRGMPVFGNDNTLLANTSEAENPATASGAFISPTATGFTLNVPGSNLTNTTATFIYIAIRRGPMKVPTSGTSVYGAYAKGTGTGVNYLETSFPADAFWAKNRTSGSFNWFDYDRLRGKTQYLGFNTTAAEVTGTGGYNVNFGTSTTTYPYALQLGETNDYNTNANNTAAIFYWLRRAPSFFDEVCYTGTGGASTVAHNLTVVPELVITKARNVGRDWNTYHSALGNTKAIFLSTTGTPLTSINYWNNTSPTSSVFSVANETNRSGDTMVAYLFATCPGVSKVGSYTGTGTTQQIDCGFTGGARFVLIKKTSGTGSWYVWDSARGIVSGNDPYLLLNSTAAEVTSTDYIDTYSAGFEISSTAPSEINENGGSFIFLAIS